MLNLQEFVVKHVFDFHPQVNFPFQQLLHEVSSHVILDYVEIDLLVDHFGQVLNFFDVEGVFSRQQFIGEDAKCPDVNCLIVLFVSHKFGSEIEWCPALGIPHGLISKVD